MRSCCLENRTRESWRKYREIGQYAKKVIFHANGCEGEGWLVTWINRKAVISGQMTREGQDWLLYISKNC